MIIAIEGMDACGKATHSKLLAEKIGGTRFTFPDYTTPSGGAILSHLKKDWEATHISGLHLGCKNTGVDAMVFQCLQTVNRLELLPAIRDAFTKGPVVFDRYTASGVVYGSLDGLDREWLEQINSSLPKPDLWILIDISVDESFERRPDRRDRYETDHGYLEKVRASYLRLFEEHSKSGRWKVVNGNAPTEEVQERILKLLEVA